MSARTVLQKKLANETPGVAMTPGIMEQAKTMGTDAMGGLKDWAGKPGITSGVTGLNRGAEAGIATGTLAGAALLAHILRKKKHPEAKFAAAYGLGKTVGNAFRTAGHVLESKPVRAGAAVLGLGAAASLANKGISGGPSMSAPAIPEAPVVEPGMLDKIKTMGGNAIDAAKTWAGKPGITGLGLSRGAETGIAAGTLAAGALLAHLLRKKKAETGYEAE